MNHFSRNITYTLYTNVVRASVNLAIKVQPGTEQEVIRELEKVICQVKETQEALEVKQKIWEAREANLVDQPEPEHLTPNNDPRLPEKEQSQRIRNRSKQYIISYPQGVTRCKVTGHVRDNSDLAEWMLKGLRAGEDVTMPDTWKVQVIDL